MGQHVVVARVLFTIGACLMAGWVVGYVVTTLLLPTPWWFRAAVILYVGYPIVFAITFAAYLLERRRKS